jgi:hypothetical protein
MRFVSRSNWQCTNYPVEPNLTDSSENAFTAGSPLDTNDNVLLGTDTDLYRTTH